MKKNVLSLSIAVAFGGLGFIQSEDCYYVPPPKKLPTTNSVQYEGVVYSLLSRGWI